MRTPARILLSFLAVAAGLTAFTGSASAAVGLNLSGQTLTVTGDDGANQIAFQAKPGDPSVLQVNVDSQPDSELDAPRAQVKSLQVFGQGGDDRVVFDTAQGPVTAGISTSVFGGDGKDTIRG